MTDIPLAPHSFWSRLAAWGFIATSAAMLATYAAVSFVLINFLIGTKDSALILLGFGLSYGATFFFATLVVRAIFRWPVHPFSMGILAALSQTGSLGTGLVLTAAVVDRWEPLHGLIAALPIGLVLFLAGYRRLGREADEEQALPLMLRLLLGVLTMVLILRVFGGPIMAPGFDLASALGSALPFAALITGFCYLWRARRGIAWPIWPASAAVMAVFVTTVNVNRFSLNQVRDDEVAFTLGLAISPLLVMLAFALFRFVRRWLPGVTEARGGLGAILTDEFTGGPLRMDLPRRRSLLLLDLIYLAIFALLLWRGLTGEVSFRYSELVEGASLVGYLFSAVFVLWSLILRLAVRRRLRIVHAIVAFIPATVIGIVLFAGVALPLIAAVLGNGEDADIAKIIAAVLILVPSSAGTLLVIRKVTFTWPLLKRIGLVFLGALLADALFLMFVGEDAAERFAIGIGVGHVAALCIVAAAGALYWRHRDEPSAFLVWPVTAVGAGLLLRLLVTAEGRLNDFDSRIATGWGEIIVCCIFGALAAEGAILAKRVWYDRDPQARLDAVRVRGAALILLGVWPVILLLFVLSSVRAFTVDIADEVGLIGTEAVAFKAQAETVGAALSKAATDVGQSIDNLKATALEAQRRAEAEIERLPGDIGAIAADATDAAKRVASVAVSEAKKTAGETVGKVTAALGEALTPPPLDLGFVSIELPDLGIGDAIKGALGGIFGNIDFSGLLSGFVGTMTNTISEQFAGPLADAEEIVARMKGHADFVTGSVKTEVENVRRTAEGLRALAQTEYDAALARSQRVIVQVVFIGYHVVVLLFMLSVALLGWLTWKAVNGLIQMIARVRMGWTMLVEGRDPLA